MRAKSKWASDVSRTTCSLWPPEASDTPTSGTMSGMRVAPGTLLKIEDATVFAATSSWLPSSLPKRPSIPMNVGACSIPGDHWWRPNLASNSPERSCESFASRKALAADFRGLLIPIRRASF